MNKKYESVNPFILFVFFIAAVIVSLPLRVYQLMTNIEPITGFWNNRDDITVYILYAMLGIAPPGKTLPALHASDFIVDERAIEEGIRAMTELLQAADGLMVT